MSSACSDNTDWAKPFESLLQVASCSSDSNGMAWSVLTNPWDILSGRANNPPPKKKSKSKFTMKLCSTMSLLLD